LRDLKRQRTAAFSEAQFMAQLQQQAFHRNLLSNPSALCSICPPGVLPLHTVAQHVQYFYPQS
jgi:hypothetical protein